MCVNKSVSSLSFVCVSVCLWIMSLSSFIFFCPTSRGRKLSAFMLSPSVAISNPLMLPYWISGLDGSFGRVGTRFGASEVQIVLRVVTGTLILPLGFFLAGGVGWWVAEICDIMSASGSFILRFVGGIKIASLFREEMISDIFFELVIISGLYLLIGTAHIFGSYAAISSSLLGLTMILGVSCTGGSPKHTIFFLALGSLWLGLAAAVGVSLGVSTTGAVPNVTLGLVLVVGDAGEAGVAVPVDVGGGRAVPGGRVCSGGGSCVLILYKKLVPFRHWVSISDISGPMYPDSLGSL